MLTSIIFNYGFMKKVMEDINSHSEEIPVSKTGIFERLTKRHEDIKKLHVNIDDEFSDPKIGPCESALSKYMNQICQEGKLEKAIEVVKLNNGEYRIVNGHHRWAAAMETGLSTVPIHIVNYAY